MSSGKFESPTKRCQIVSWNPESKAVLCNFMFSVLFAALFQVWNRNYHCCLQNIIHLGLGPSLEDADYLILINYFDIVDHKRPIDLSSSSVSDIKPKRILGSRMGKHVSSVHPLAIKSVGCYLISCHVRHQHANALYLLGFPKFGLILQNFEDVDMDWTASVMKEIFKKYKHGIQGRTSN